VAPITYRNLSPNERKALMGLAALHTEFGPDGAWHSSAVEHVLGQSVVAELGMLQMYGLADLIRNPEGFGYRLNGAGFDALPDSMEKAKLLAHREEAEQGLREEQ
jgi:hypothetical protein